MTTRAGRIKTSYIMDNYILPSQANTGKCLLDEYPIIVIPSLAVMVGDREAMFLQQIHYWLVKNENTKRNFINGRYWTFNTYEQWQLDFPWLSVMTLKRIVEKLRNQGLIITDHFNKKGYDRTLWYTINYERLEAVKNSGQDKVTKRNNAKYQNETMESNEMLPPIPETIKETKEERGAPSKPSAPKDEKPKNGSDLGAAIGHYKDWFSLKTDRTPDVKEKDAAALKRVVNSYGLEDTKTMLNLYFEDKDPFYLENGFPLTTFASQVNKFVVKLNNKGFNDLADRKFSKVSDDLPTYEGVCSDCNTVIFKGKKHECYKPDQNTPGHDIRELTNMIGKGI